jgi:uncharacterized protein YjbI with pentapeptide repeats
MNEKHLAVLKKGVATWNAWRRGSQVFPDLKRADLGDANLQDATLHHADLRGEDLIEHLRVGSGAPAWLANAAP